VRRMRAVVVREYGGPEVLRVERVARPSPPRGYDGIAVQRAGVNFFDTERRRSWRTAELPVILGTEVLGRRERDGARVVGLTDGGLGGYAEFALVPEQLAVPVPDKVSDTAALATLVQGLTAWHLLVTAARIRRGESVVITAAAGGVGSIAVQIARSQGASRVIALASTEAKRAIALQLGADVALDSSPDRLTERVLRANGDDPVDVALESVAGPVLDRLVAALGVGGRLVAYGQASGASNVVPVDLLMSRSIGVIGFWLTPYLADRTATRTVIEQLLADIADGRLQVLEGAAFPIAAAADAHSLISAGGTTGKITLTGGNDGWGAR
jgi:NADPH:quinone reductase